MQDSRHKFKMAATNPRWPPWKSKMAAAEYTIFTVCKCTFHSNSSVALSCVDKLAGKVKIGDLYVSVLYSKPNYPILVNNKIM